MKLAVCVSSFVEVASMIWYSFFGILVLFIKQDIFCFVLFVARISNNGANAGVIFYIMVCCEYVIMWRLDFMCVSTSNINLGDLFRYFV